MTADRPAPHRPRRTRPSASEQLVKPGEPRSVASPSHPFPCVARKRRRSHIRIVRAAATLGHDPVYVLRRILDVTSLAVDAVLRADLQSLVIAVRRIDDLVDAGRTITLLRRIVERIVYRDRQRRVLKLQMRRLVLLVIGIRDEDRGE